MIRVNSAISRMLALPLGERSRARDAIILSLLPVIGRRAKKWCRANADGGYTHLEDVQGEAAVIVTRLLRDVATGRIAPKNPDWDKYLGAVLNKMISQWFKSAAVTPLSGVVAIERRLARIPQVIDRLHGELGREPSAEEVHASQHAEMWGRQKDPKRHGSLVSLAEVRNVLGRAA